MSESVSTFLIPYRVQLTKQALWSFPRTEKGGRSSLRARCRHTSYNLQSGAIPARRKAADVVQTGGRVRSSRKTKRIWRILETGYTDAWSFPAHRHVQYNAKRITRLCESTLDYQKRPSTTYLYSSAVLNCTRSCKTR